MYTMHEITIARLLLVHICVHIVCSIVYVIDQSAVIAFPPCKFRFCKTAPSNSIRQALYSPCNLKSCFQRARLVRCLNSLWQYQNHVAMQRKFDDMSIFPSFFQMWSDKSINLEVPYLRLHYVISL